MEKNIATGPGNYIHEILRSVATGNSLLRARGELATFSRYPRREIDSVKSKTLAAAARILEERGLEKLSLRSIADSAGIGLASIYHYFSSKEELLLQLAVSGFGELREDMLYLQSSSERLSPRQASARAFFNFALTRRALFSLMFDEKLMVRHACLREAEQQALQIFQAALLADGRIPREHQEGASYALWAMGRGMASVFSSHPNGEIPIELVEKIFAGVAYLLGHGQ